jgi:putative flippase GtrA
VFNLLLMIAVFENGQLKAKVVATCVAIISSYFMNRHWTYKDRDKSAAHREFILFLVFNGIGMAIELAVMGVTKYWLGMTSWLALNVALVIGLALGTVLPVLHLPHLRLHAGDRRPGDGCRRRVRAAHRATRRRNSPPANSGAGPRR